MTDSLPFRTKEPMSSGEVTINGKTYRVDQAATLEEVFRVEELGGCDIFFISTSERWRGTPDQMLSTFVDPRRPIISLPEPHVFYTHRLMLNDLTIWVGSKPVHMRLDFTFMSSDVPALIAELPTDRVSIEMPSLGDIEDYVRNYLSPKKARETDHPIFTSDGKIVYNGNTNIRPGGLLRIPLRDGETIADVIMHPRDASGQINYKVNGFVYSERVDTKHWVYKDDADEVSDTPHVLDGAYLVNATSGTSIYLKAKVKSHEMVYEFKNGDRYYRLVFCLDDESYHVIKSDPVSARTITGGHEYYKEIDPYFSAYIEKYKPKIKGALKTRPAGCPYCGKSGICYCGD